MSVPLPQPPPSLPRRGWLAMVLSPLPGVIPPTAPLATLWEPALQSQYVDIVVYMFILYCQLVYQIHIIQFKRNNQCSVRVRFVSPLFVGPHASQEKVKQRWGSSPFAGITAVLSKLKHIAIENL